tara:strand:+ start:411 stop:1028 length:618 start_codon:yes stop_codon:yes gene_type:complete
MTTQLNDMIQSDLTAAYNGELNITLSQALSVIAAHFYDPSVGLDREGNSVERNNLQWDQRLALQSLANFANKQLHDTSVNADGKVKGVVHKLNKAMAYAKQLGRNMNGSEIDLQAGHRAADWIERLEYNKQVLEEFYYTAAYVYDNAVGETFKPYENWTTAKPANKVSDIALREMQDRLAALGVETTTDYVANTNGVDTQEVDVA